MTGIELIAKERQRQVDVEGHSTLDDSLKGDEHLYSLALFYLLKDSSAASGVDKELKIKKKNKCRLRQLVVAGALIAAEIDRMNECICASCE